MRYLVVGSGFAGSVVAERLASDRKKVLVIDKRHHIAGNAYDELDDHGVLIHRYGPHIFHTNIKQVFDYLSGFTDWRSYEHRVLSFVNGNLYPFPINRTTLNMLYGLNLDEEGAAEYLNEVRESRNSICNSEDLILSSVGRDLYEKFFLNYTRKQWGLEPGELRAGVAARIPVRTNDDDRYFTDTVQVMPVNGYTSMFQNMLSHPGIELELGVNFFDVHKLENWKHVIYTGPIDEYFKYCFGRLPYRSLYFEYEHFATLNLFQPVGTVNYPNDLAFTRITEFKHITGQKHTGTSIVREFPTSHGDPYYPIPCDNNEVLYKHYMNLAKKEPNVSFVGRLAEYRYYNMDQVVEAALNLADQLLKVS